MLLILFQISNFFKFVQILIISGLKFIIAPPISLEMGFSWFQTVLFTTIGGIIGVIVSYYLGEILLKLFRILLVQIKAILIYLKRVKLTESAIANNKKVQKKIFTKKNRFIVNIKGRFGLFGLAAITPIFLSIPLGTILISKYYPNKSKVFFALSSSVACWSFIVSSVYFIF